MMVSTSLDRLLNKRNQILVDIGDLVRSHAFEGWDYLQYIIDNSEFFMTIYIEPNRVDETIVDYVVRTIEDSIKFQKLLAASSNDPYSSDREALEDYLITNWGSIMFKQERVPI